MRITDSLLTVTPARVAALVAYAVGVFYPGMNPDIRGAIVGVVTGLYVLCVAAVEVAERKHGTGKPSPGIHASTRTRTTEEIKEIR